MNLKSMKQTALDLYDWAKEQYKDKNIIIMAHSYGKGVATYLASKRKCNNLILLAAYHDLPDLYNSKILLFWGPAKIFISNNIRLSDYAKKFNCHTSIISSYMEKYTSCISSNIW